MATHLGRQTETVFMGTPNRNVLMNASVEGSVGIAIEWAIWGNLATRVMMQVLLRERDLSQNRQGTKKSGRLHIWHFTTGADLASGYESWTSVFRAAHQNLCLSTTRMHTHSRMRDFQNFDCKWSKTCLSGVQAEGPGQWVGELGFRTLYLIFQY